MGHDVGSILVCASNPGDGMSKFKITVARIEVNARREQDAQVFRNMVEHPERAGTTQNLVQMIIGKPMPV